MKTKLIKYQHELPRQYVLRREAGFAMLEALIAMVVILMGVLGVAGIQMLSINNTKNAEYQGIAALTASNMVAAMQANPDYWLTAGGKTISVSGSTITGGPAGGTDCSAATCDAAKMAAYDLSQWGASVAATVPTGTGSVVCNTASPVECTVTMNWTVKNVANLKAASADVDSTHLFASGTVRARSYQTLAVMR